MNAPEVGAFELSGVPGNAACEWHCDTTIDNIAHGNSAQSSPPSRQ